MAADPFDLTGRVALVTGSSRGLGKVLARGLAAAGATVCLHGLDLGEVATVQTDASGIARGLQRLARDVGPVDVLVNNAGINLRGPLAEIDPDVFRAVIDTNLTGVLLVTQPVARGMIERRRGKIINICSLMSEVGRETTGAYTASKGGLRMLTRAMATEWARHNIQVNGIGPGYFATEMTRPLVEDEAFNAWITARTPARRWGDPAELIGPAVFLASDAASFVNGQILYVDGGILAAL